MNTFSKQPNETYSIAVEFAGKLPSGASLSSGTVAAYDAQGTNVSASTLVSTSVTVSGTQARTKVFGGIHGQEYRIQLQMILTNADLLEEDVLMKVVNQ